MTQIKDALEKVENKDLIVKCKNMFNVTHNPFDDEPPTLSAASTSNESLSYDVVTRFSKFKQVHYIKLHSYCQVSSIALSVS